MHKVTESQSAPDEQATVSKPAFGFDAENNDIAGLDKGYIDGRESDHE